MKFHLFPCLLIASIPCFLSAQEDPLLLKTRLDLLEAKRELTLKEMARMRQDLIRKDPALRKIHEKIIQEHRKLALFLDSKKEIHEINDKLIKLDTEITEIKARKEKIEKEIAEKEKAEKMKAEKEKAEKTKLSSPAPANQTVPIPRKEK